MKMMYSISYDLHSDKLSVELKTYSILVLDHTLYQTSLKQQFSD